MTGTTPSSQRTSGRALIQRIVGAHLLAAVFALLAVNAIFVARNCDELRSPAPGMRAPDFTLPSTGGKQVRLDTLRGQVVLIDFWASWCPPCRKKFPLLVKLQRELGPRGFRVLAVNTEGDPLRAKRFLREQGIARDTSADPQRTITALIDDGQTATAYGVQTIPHIVVVGRDGKIVHVHVGTGGESRLADEVRVALAAP